MTRRGMKINACRSLVGKLERKTPFGRSRRRWEIILKWMFWKCGIRTWDGFIWLGIGQWGLVNTIINHCVA